MEEPSQMKITIPAGTDHALVTGTADSTLRSIEEACAVSVTLHGDQIAVSGSADACAFAARVLGSVIESARSGLIVDARHLDNIMGIVRDGTFSAADLSADVLHTNRGRVIRPKTSGQKRYADAIRSHAITFGLGPAGTGKTFIACAVAADMLMRNEVKRIVLCRPIVEAGESLGYLPGTLMEKVDPYNRPLYDALFDMLDAEKANRMLQDGIIEVVPLAFMRGRTFNRSFVILDEAQNATREQMKLFLTRLGFGTKMVVTGDESQSDSPHGPTGLAQARAVLKGIDEIAFCELEGSDVVRHELVARIVSAYERAGEENDHGRSDR